MECIAYPGGAQAIGCQANIVLAPDLFVFKRVSLAELTPQIPGERIDLATFLDVFDDYRKVGFGT